MLRPGVGLKMFELYFTPAPLGHQNSEVATYVGSGHFVCYEQDKRTYIFTHLPEGTSRLPSTSVTWEEEGDNPSIFQGTYYMACKKLNDTWTVKISKEI